MKSTYRWAAAMGLLINLPWACGDDTNPVDMTADAMEAPTADAMESPGEIALSHEPAWIARSSPDEPCFGRSAAVADIDGDGHGDLLVGISRCSTGGPDRLAIFPGGDQLFAQDAMRVTIDWNNANPFPIGLALDIDTADVNGDQRTDVLLSSRDGVALFLGTDDLSTVFSEPAFRVPGESFGSSLLADVNGDEHADIVARTDGATTVFLADIAAGEVSFVQARTIASGRPNASGDVNDDGNADVLVAGATGSVGLYLGCSESTPEVACDGGLSSEPVWEAPGRAIASDIDIDADDHFDVLTTDVGRIRLHRAEPATGRPADTAAWAPQGDPLFPAFGLAATSPGDVLGDGTANELLVSATGRVYLYAVPEGPVGDLAPVWAFPEADTLTSEWASDITYTVASAGDVNGDERPDFVVAGTSTVEGVVMVFTGGALPQGAATPYIPEALTCQPPDGTLPDLTVDAELLERSVQITRQQFDAASCEVLEGCVGAAGERRLLRFSVSIPNLGTGDAAVLGPEDAPELYYFDECHGHDHLIDFSSYRLIGGDGSEVTGRKQGFYFVDNAPYCANAAPPGVPGTLPGMRISAGWSDIYLATYPCQWIDITGVPDGMYELRVSVDDLDIIEEADAQPNAVTISIEIQQDEVTVVP